MIRKTGRPEIGAKGDHSAGHDMHLIVLENCNSHVVLQWWFWFCIIVTLQQFKDSTRPFAARMAIHHIRTWTDNPILTVGGSNGDSVTLEHRLASHNPIICGPNGYSSHKNMNQHIIIRPFAAQMATLSHKNIDWQVTFQPLAAQMAIYHIRTWTKNLYSNNLRL